MLFKVIFIDDSTIISRSPKMMSEMFRKIQFNSEIYNSSSAIVMNALE